jgi:hypothetical protein
MSMFGDEPERERVVRVPTTGGVEKPGRPLDEIDSNTREAEKLRAQAQELLEEAERREQGR